MRKENLTPIQWTRTNEVRFLRQDLLPHTIEYHSTDDYRVICSAIKKLWVRGAPTVGISAAMALALAACKSDALSIERFKKDLNKILLKIKSTRPTAKNISTALDEMTKVLNSQTSVLLAKKALKLTAVKLLNEQIESCQKIVANGYSLLPQGGVLTHCNAGPLACCGCGTALGIITKAYHDGQISHVIVDETRPLLQGTRITTFELKKAKVPHFLITDSMAAWAMQKGLVQSVIVGADRIAQNGDTANKVGTYALALLAQEHGIPFFVAAPMSTFDHFATSGKDIIIEEREGTEITSFASCVVAPLGTKTYNPSFDVTPAKLITAIVNEDGIFGAPYDFGKKDEI